MVVEVISCCVDLVDYAKQIPQPMATNGSTSVAIVPPGPRSRALRAAATGRGRGRGRAGVQIPAEVLQLPELPERVEYYNTEGQLRFVDIPSADHVELTLAGVQVSEGVPQLPELPARVEYYNTDGQLRFFDIPSPDHMELTLPPGVQHVCFFHYIFNCRLLFAFPCVWSD